MRVEKLQSSDGKSKGWIIFPKEDDETCRIQVLWFRSSSHPHGNQQWEGPQYFWEAASTANYDLALAFSIAMDHAVTLGMEEPD